MASRITEFTSVPIPLEMAPTTPQIVNVFKETVDNAPKTPTLKKMAINTALLTIHLATLIFKLFNWILKTFFGFEGQQRALYRELHNVAEEGDEEEIRQFLTEHAAENYLCAEFLPHPELFPHLPEILRGANVCLKDGGVFYKRWQSHGRQRKSSHKCEGKSYEIDHFHFWLQGGDTRFQFEKSPLKGVFSSIDHLIDYLRYKRDNQQQGITGSSPHLDSNPLQCSIGVTGA